MTESAAGTIERTGRSIAGETGTGGVATGKIEAISLIANALTAVMGTLAMIGTILQEGIIGGIWDAWSIGQAQKTIARANGLAMAGQSFQDADKEHPYSQMK